MIWLAVWYVLMGMTTWILIHRELNRGHQLTKRVNTLLTETPVPYWVVIIASMAVWPWALWRLHRGFPEDSQ